MEQAALSLSDGRGSCSAFPSGHIQPSEKSPFKPLLSTPVNQGHISSSLFTSMWFQYVESPSFDRRGLDPVSVLHQTMAGLAHLHSLSIGERAGGQYTGRKVVCLVLVPSSAEAAGFGQRLSGLGQQRAGHKQSPVLVAVPALLPWWQVTLCSLSQCIGT